MHALRSEDDVIMSTEWIFRMCYKFVANCSGIDLKIYNTVNMKSVKLVNHEFEFIVINEHVLYTIGLNYQLLII